MWGFENFFETLPLWATTSLVALVAVVVVLLACVIFPRRMSIWWAVVVPFAVAYCAYWFPVWRGADSSEYSAWALLVIGIWFVAGFVPSAILIRFLRSRRPNASAGG
jgi:hypothetical protein